MGSRTITMKAWQLHQTADLSKVQHPLRLVEVPVPKPGNYDFLVKALTS